MRDPNLILILIGIVVIIVVISGCVEKATNTPANNATASNTTADPVDSTKQLNLFQNSEISITVGGENGNENELKPAIKNAVLSNIFPSQGVTYDIINISANKKVSGSGDYEVKVTCSSPDTPFTDKYLFLYTQSPAGDEILLRSYVLMAVSKRDSATAINIASNREIQQELENYKIYSEPTVKRILPKDSKKYGGVEKTLFSVTWAGQNRNPVVVSLLVDTNPGEIVKRWSSGGDGNAVISAAI